MKNLAKFLSGGVAALCLVTALPAFAAQLSGDARAAIPHDVQQLIVIDYRAMQNSPAAMQLKNKVMPPELKSLEKALQVSGMNDNHDVDELAFASFRPKGATGDSTRIIGLAQGQFSLDDIMANFKKKKIKPTVLRDNKIYPMGASGMQVVFLNPTTMVFGQTDSLKQALDSRDGLQPSFLTNSAMTDMMASVQDEPLWSILDQKGTQTMMRSLMGEACAGGRLRHHQEADSHLVLHHGFPEWGEIQSRRADAGHLHRRHDGFAAECGRACTRR